MKMLKKTFIPHAYSDNASSFSKDTSQGVARNAFSKEKRRSLKMRQKFRKRSLIMRAPADIDRLYPPQ